MGLILPDEHIELWEKIMGNPKDFNLLMSLGVIKAISEVYGITVSLRPTTSCNQAKEIPGWIALYPESVPVCLSTTRTD